MPSCSGRCVPRIFQEKLLRYRRSRCGVLAPHPLLCMQALCRWM